MTAPLMEHFFQQIKSELKLFNSNKQINSLLIVAERKTGLKSEQIISYVFFILMLYLTIGWNRELICNFIGFSLPAYASLLTLGSPVISRETKWSVYWVIYVLFGFLENLLCGFLQMLPFYWLGKCIFHIWLMIPGPVGGANMFYQHMIGETILADSQEKQIQHQDSVDQITNPTEQIDKLANSEQGGACTGYCILIGQFFTSGDMTEPIEALQAEGFQVDNVKDENSFVSKLRSNNYQIAWIISSSSIENTSFISTLLDFHSAGGAVFLFADNIPYVSHASEFLYRRFGIILTGNYPGNKTLVFKENNHFQAGHFGQHEIFNGIEYLFEGVTICHPLYPSPTNRKPMTTLATATDGNPCITVFDPSLENINEGRLCLDCGFTKLFINWKSPGTARFIVNASRWLARTKK